MNGSNTYNDYYSNNSNEDENQEIDSDSGGGYLENSDITDEDSEQKDQVVYVSQTPFFPSIIYQTDPSILPRPRMHDIYFTNDLDQSIYTANPNSYPVPFSNSIYLSREFNNSSIRLIRPSMQVIPYDLSFYSKTGLPFGFNIEPFRERDKEPVPIREESPNTPNSKILQCSHCKGYYTKNFKISEEQNNLVYKKYSYKCAMCRKRGFFYTVENTKIDCTDYFDKDKEFYIPDNEDPSFEYIIGPEKEVSQNILFMIDFSFQSIHYGFTKYALDCLHQLFSQESLEDERTFSFAIFDSLSIKFFSFDKRENLIRMTVMPDLNEPYCPLNYKDMFFDRKIGLIIIEKILSLIDDVKNDNNSSCLNSAFYSAVDLAKQTDKGKYFSIIIFQCNSLSNGVKHVEEINWDEMKKSKRDNAVYLPTSEVKEEEELNVNFYLFLCGYSHHQVHLANYTKHRLYYYAIDSVRTIKGKFEKMYMDLFELLSPENEIIFDVNCRICFNMDKFTANGVSLYNNKDSTHEFKMPSCLDRRKLSFIFILNNFFEIDITKETHFQFWISFISSKDKKRHLRVLNHTTKSSTNAEYIFCGLDCDCLLRLVLIEQIKKCKYDLRLAKTKVTELISAALLYYKIEVFMGNEIDSLTFPISIRHLALYFFSFFSANPILNWDKRNLNTNQEHFNQITWRLYKLFTSPLNQVVKMIYPLLYHVNKEKISLVGLSQYFIPKTDMILLLDNGEEITIFIMEGVSDNDIQIYFNRGKSFEEVKSLLKSNEEIELNYENLKKEIFNVVEAKIPNFQVVFSGGTEELNKLKYYLVEDHDIGYGTYLIKLKEEISKKVLDSL